MDINDYEPISLCPRESVQASQRAIEQTEYYIKQNILLKTLLVRE